MSQQEIDELGRREAAARRANKTNEAEEIRNERKALETSTGLNVSQDVAADIVRSRGGQGATSSRADILSRIGGVSSSSTTTTSSTTGEQQRLVTERCRRLAEDSEHFKNGFETALLEASNSVVKRTQDQIFFETCNLITNVRSNLPRTSLLQNLIFFVYGDRRGRVTKKQVRDAGKFKHIIFLTVLTSKTLLDPNTQEDTFQLVKRKAFPLGTINVTSFITEQRRSTGCRKVKLPGRFKKVRECTQEQWANIYLVFPEERLINAIEDITKGVSQSERVASQKKISKKGKKSKK